MTGRAAIAIAALALGAAGCSPETHGCGEETTPIDTDDATALGVSPGEMAALCPTVINADLKREDGSLVAMQAQLTVDPTRAELVHVIPAKGLEILCGDDFIRVPAFLTITTTDGSFSSSGPALVTGSTATNASVQQMLMLYNHTQKPLYQTQGTFTGALPADLDVDGYDAAAVSVGYACPAGNGAAAVYITDIDGQFVAGFQEPIGSWTLPTGSQP